MYDSARDLVDSMSSASDALEAVLVGVDDDLAGRARGGDEGWNVVEVLCHLRDAEERAVERLRAMRDEEEPYLPAYDQDAWAAERDYADDDLRRAAAAFARHRGDHVAELRALPATAWERAGTHEEQGRITILNHTIHIATHDLQHLALVARALRYQRRSAGAAR